jgi:NADH-quinone oxidoreductase subunit M
VKIPYLLSLITWLPALGAIVVLFLFKKEQTGAIKRFATAWFALDFLVSLGLLSYDRGMGGFQFLEDAQWIPVIGARYQMGADGVAVLLILLTTLLGWIASLSSWEYIQKREKEYYVLLLLLQTSVLGVFDVLPHRHLGRRAASLRGHQVLPLHAGRLGRAAARHD